jgi:hypothetical protein
MSAGAYFRGLLSGVACSTISTQLCVAAPATHATPGRECEPDPLRHDQARHAGKGERSGEVVPNALLQGRADPHGGANLIALGGLRLSNAAFAMPELKARGRKFALDVLGTGLPSFVYLKSLPVDFL